MKPTDEQVEAGAIALREIRNVSGVGDPGPWDAAPKMAQAMYRLEARTVLEAVDAPADSLSDLAMERLHEWVAAAQGRAVTISLDLSPGACAADVLVSVGEGHEIDPAPADVSHDRDAILPMAVLGALDEFARSAG